MRLPELRSEEIDALWREELCRTFKRQWGVCYSVTYDRDTWPLSTPEVIDWFVKHAPHEGPIKYAVSNGVFFSNNEVTATLFKLQFG